MKPLLHTWSLAVEEQFYIFLPIFLLVLSRYSHAVRRMSVLAIAICSFLVSAWGAFHSRQSTFYLAHTRAWELLLGTLLFLDIVPSLSRAIWRNLSSAVGLSMVLTSAMWYQKTTPFPGLAAALPCIGAALIIAAGRDGSSFVGSILSLRPVVFIGTISYSLYLWHWPLIVFQGASGIFAHGLTPKTTKLMVLGISFVVATLSWRFVERPFRDSRKRLPRPRLFQIATSAASMLAIFGVTSIATHGFPFRYSSQAVRVASFLENGDATTEAQYREGSCFLTSRNPQAKFAAEECLKSDRTRRNDLLIGDSHAAQLWFGLSSIFKDINFMQATASGCKPALQQPIGADERCTQLMQYVFQDYLKTHSVDCVLIAARWDSTDLARLEETVLLLKQRKIKVVLFGPIVQYDAALPRLLAISIQKNDPRLPGAHRVSYYEELDRKMAEIARQLGVRYVSYFDLICPHGPCLEYAAKDVPLQSDYGHLTGDGSVVVADKIRDAGIFSISPTDREALQ